MSKRRRFTQSWCRIVDNVSIDNKIGSLLMGTLLVIYLFPMLGCSRGLSEKDKQWLTHTVDMAALKNENALLKKENEKLKGLIVENGDLQKLNAENRKLQVENGELMTENRKLKERIAELDEEIPPLDEETPPSPPHTIFRVNDKLPDFRNDILWDLSSGPPLYVSGGSYSISWLSDRKAQPKFQIIYIEDAIVGGHRFNPYIFQKKGTWIELKNGTRYICTSSEGCEVINFSITKGTIEVRRNKNGN